MCVHERHFHLTKKQWRLHNCGNTTEATTLLQQFFKKKKKKKNLFFQNKKKSTHATLIPQTHRGIVLPRAQLSLPPFIRSFALSQHLPPPFWGGAVVDFTSEKKKNNNVSGDTLASRRESPRKVLQETWRPNKFGEFFGIFVGNLANLFYGRHTWSAVF